MFQLFFEMKLLHLLHQKILYLLYDTLNWATPGISTTTCLVPTIIWGFYYDATKLVQAENCIIIRATNF